jgi:hypothetical protein
MSTDVDIGYDHYNGLGWQALGFATSIIPHLHLKFLRSISLFLSSITAETIFYMLWHTLNTSNWHFEGSLQRGPKKNLAASGWTN